MSLADDLRALRGNSQATLHDFLLSLHKESGHCLHLFYEGKTDNGFYGSMIRRLIKNGTLIKTHVCGNKNEVYRARERLLVREYDNNQLLFFADKDLDDLIVINRTSHNDLHVTNTYSIENYLIDEDLFTQSCSEVFKINSGSEQIKHIGKTFTTCNNDFCEWAANIMAWILCCRRLGSRPNLSEIKMSEICKIDDNMVFSSIKSGPDLLTYLTEKTKSTVSITTSYHQEVLQELKLLEPKSYIRGKFHLWLLIECIKRAKKALEDAEGKNIKLHINLNSFTVIDICAPRLKAPDTIVDFLQANGIAQVQNAA